MSSIFIAIPCLRDPEIHHTLNDIFTKSKNPENIYVGLFYQYANEEENEYIKEEIKKYPNIALKTAPAKDNLGISKGRNGARQLYSGQKYFLQIDSHTKFEKGWDKNLITTLHEAVNYVGSEKIILTTYLNEYHYKKGLFSKRVLRNGNSRPTYNYMVNDDLVLNYLPRWKNDFGDFDKPFLPSRKFAANFVFTYGKYQEDIALEDEVIFWSEEYSKSVDLLYKGYALVHPNKEILLTHLYADHQNEYSGTRLALEHYVGDRSKNDLMFAEEESFIKNYIENHPFKKEYEEYAGIKFNKKACKSRFYIPPSFFPKNKV